MIKLAIALCLSLGACSADRVLDAQVLRTYASDGTIQVWIPEYEDTFTINVEDYAGGAVLDSALTCLSLVDLGRMDPSLRYYFPPQSDDKSSNDVPTANDGSRSWTLKGCEGLNEFKGPESGLGPWVVPALSRDPRLADMQRELADDCAETDGACDGYTDGGWCVD